jgi:DNA invertase Pin-like site-specific DNA recombinase
VANAEVRCAIYTRKSTEEGLSQEFNSLDAQREAAESYIQSQRGLGWKLIATRYDDGGFSGGTLDRPALQQLLADVDAGLVNCILVYKVDRLSRSLLDFARIMERFDQQSVSFVSITQQFNTTTSLGRLTLNILLSFAQFEREIIGERTRDKLGAARRKGKWIGGTPPLGYDVAPEGRRLLINDAEAAQVREIFALYAHHCGLIPVVEELNRRGWRTKHWTSRTGRCHPGQPFSKQALLSILKSVTYIGQVNYKGTIYPGEQPPVVDERLWQEVNQRLESQRWPEPQRAGKPAPLKGLLRCEPCKAVMIPSETRKQGRAYRYYVCANAQRRGWKACPSQAIPAKVVEESVLEQVRKNCKLGKRHQQEHVGERLNRLVERVGYDGTTGRVTLNFRPAAGVDEPVLTYSLGRVEKPAQMAEATHLPRVTRLLALALKCEGLVRSGTIPEYAELARRGWVTRARVTQIMNLLHLATPIQEEILSWSEVENERDPVSERALRRLTRIPMWSKQLELWKRLAPANHASGAAAGKPVAPSRA